LNSPTKIIAIILSALALEALFVVSPRLVQIITDNIIPTSDFPLAYLLIAAFCLVAVWQLVFGLCRGKLLSTLSERLTVSWDIHLAEHLLRLPYRYFLRRPTADIFSRFHSIDIILETVTRRFVGSALDVLGLIATLLMILLYSWQLAMITVGAGLLYAISRRLTIDNAISAEKHVNREMSVKQGRLMEMLHSVATIKCNGIESTAITRYCEKAKSAASAGRQVNQWRILSVSLAQFVNQFHSVIVIGVGAIFTLRGNITFGMVMAYMLYSNQFMDRCTRVSDILAECKVLGAHTSRLSDILDEDAPTSGIQPMPLTNALVVKVRNLSFGYNNDKSEILNKVSFDVRPGECVAITGVSGVGKSTLLKLLVGLLVPSQGSIEYNGVTLTKLDPVGFYNSIGCVLQDDRLFAGSIFENIALFTPRYSRALVIEAAKLANIHDEIMNLPLGYESPLVNEGQTISGGQRQRIILARALYKKPRLLVLDEATSSLDVGNESAINTSLAALSMTRIIVAHRPSTIAMADRVIHLMPEGISDSPDTSEGNTSEKGRFVSTD
jgi:ATP-binding cassette subfamily B protein RaxB